MKPVILPDNTLNTRNAALYLTRHGCPFTERQLRAHALENDWLHRPGILTGVRRGKRWYFRREVLDKWIEENGPVPKVGMWERVKRWLFQ